MEECRDYSNRELHNMDYYSSQMSRLIEELSCLPGIGAKSASRLAFHLIHMPLEDVKRLALTMVEARENIKYCKAISYKMLYMR